MLTQEANDRLTRVGPGTPMGSLLRRYWFPVGTLEELLREPVQPIRLLGEDLTLFRSTTGEIGVLTDRCAHRAISLAYGIPQENGLRCAYHGWTYDTEGHVVDMPFEPTCLPLKIKAYPVQEMGGLVWTYLGPQPAPLLPRWELFARADLQRSISMKPLPCNWLQCMDNSLDPVHFEHLHGVYGNYYNRRHGKPQAMNPARHRRIEFDVFDYGIYKRRLVEGDDEANPPDDWTTGHPILFPYILLQGTDERFSYQIRVPTDDTHTLHIVYTGRPRGAGEPAQTSIPAEHNAVEYNELGLAEAPNIGAQDAMAWIGQGPISDRTLEHLVTSDKGVVLYHNLLLENIAKVERGEEPMAVIRDPAVNEPFIAIKHESVGYQSFRINRELSGAAER
jgi:5,5'-dehydrodivanillate O-demethylase oxygenase subunit